MTLDPHDPSPHLEGGAPIAPTTPVAPATRPNIPPNTSSDASTGDKVGQVKSAAADEAANVKDTAVTATKDVASEAKTQVNAVVGQTKQQIGDLVSQARGELQSQARSQGQQAAGALTTLSDRLQALVDGRPQEAGPLAGIVSEAQDKVRTYADRIGDAGPQGVLDDVTSFARRRPALFLLGAGVAGFAIGRLVKAGTAANSDDHTATTGPVEGNGLPAPSPTNLAVPPAPVPSASLRESGGGLG